MTYRNFGGRPSASSRSCASASRSSRMPVGVHRHLVHVGAAGRERRHGARVGRPLGQDRVAGVEQDAAQQVDRLLPAGRDDQLAGARLGAALRHQRGERVAQLVDALGRPVLQRARPRSRRRRPRSAPCSRSAGKARVSGRPPASEITSGRAVTAMRSRMADERSVPVRRA